MTLKQYDQPLEERNALLNDFDRLVSQHCDNASERAIRNLKVKQKVSGGFRSDRGAEIFAVLRSVVDTIIKKGGNPFESIRFAINVAVCKS